MQGGREHCPRLLGPCRLARGCSVSDDAWMASEPDQTASSEQEWVVIASFPNRHAAERMLASLGHEFRHNAHKGHADAFVVSGNADGSLKLTQSRVLEASGLAAITARLSVFMLAGLIGVGRDAEGRQGHRARSSQTFRRTSGPMSSTPTRSSLRLDRMRPFCWFAARTKRRGRRSQRERPTTRAIAGTAR